VHPGYAKDKMVNALVVANKLISLLPANERPEHTAHYEGFFHLTNVSGTVDSASVGYIIRDHNRELFEGRKKLMQETVDYINKLYPGTTTLEMKDQYYNMREKVEPVMHVVDLAFEAMTAVGVTPIVKPIRGGTDGARLSFMGLPCPNIFAGGHNFHGRYEFVPIQSMEKAVQVIVKIAELAASK
jgi:tripeptide aminopeptidase